MSDTTKTAPEKTDAEKRRAAVAAADRALRDKYRDEHIALAKAEADKLGVVYEPRKTEAEKAAEQLAALLAAHPELRSQV